MHINGLPREILEDIFWLGDCLIQRYQGKTYHSYNSSYLVVGNNEALLVETGHPKDFNVLHEQMTKILCKKQVPLKYIFTTHQETPHAGGIARFLNLYPDVTVFGDISDYHMAFPMFRDNFKSMEVGDKIDLGSMQFIAAEPVVRDIRTSLWGYIYPHQILFPGDGFAYSHYHWDGHCGKTAEEAGFQIETLPIITGAVGRLPAIEVKLNGVIAKINPSSGLYSSEFLIPVGDIKSCLL